jgi:hypothetical protein
VLAIATNDNEPGTSAAFTFRCESSDKDSPWNFTLTRQNAREYVRSFGISGGGEDVGAMGRPAGKAPPRGWYENRFADDKWGLPGRATGGNEFNSVWHGSDKYNFYRLAPRKRGMAGQGGYGVVGVLWVYEWFCSCGAGCVLLLVCVVIFFVCFWQLRFRGAVRRWARMSKRSWFH